MNPKKLQALGIVLGVGLFVATGLLVFTAADHKSSEQEPRKTPGEPSVAATIRALSDTFADVVDQVRPCVVSVHSEKVVRYRRNEWPFPFGEDFPFRWFFGEDPSQRRQRRPQPREYQVPQRGLGSGIIIDKDGRILTNHHVVQDVDEIKVTLADKRTFEAELAGSDPQTDLAIIKIKGKTPADLPVATLGDSDATRVGDWVLAIGAPFGYEQTVTAGIISAKGRANVGIIKGGYEDFIQTDAAINPGNSGGPLVNMHGEVIGINTAIATQVGQYAGVGFAIPSNMASGILPKLIKGGTVSRGLLGVIIQDINADVAEHFKLSGTRGALVAQVNEGSPAEKAGIKIGDVIVRYDGKDVPDTASLRNMVAATTPGSRVDIVILRDGKQRTVNAQIGELNAEAMAAGAKSGAAELPDIGLAVETLTLEKADEYGFGWTEGVLVTEVAPDSPAREAGLRPGDVITEVNREKVATDDEFQAALASAKGKDSALMLVKRIGVSQFVIVPLK